MNMQTIEPARAISRRPATTQKLNLALQGTGAHGAFGWGVLDKLLEDGRVTFDGISATSAGAMNAVVYAYGEMTGGASNARIQLEVFWRKVSEQGSPFSRLRNSLSLIPGFDLARRLATHQLETLTQVMSPYELNPLNFNPLKPILEAVVDFEELQLNRKTKLAFGATNVRTGRPRIFTNRDITVETVLASACVPTLFHAVEIEGEHYWDGGLAGHPTLFPLLCNTQTRDILIAQIQPLERRDLPKRALDIANRMNEISAATALTNEIWAITEMTRAVENGWIHPDHKAKFTPARLHAIRSDEVMSDLTASSRLDTSWTFLTRLRDRGREAAQLWLDTHFKNVGVQSTLDI
jgi:NTE family protein